MIFIHAIVVIAYAIGIALALMSCGTVLISRLSNIISKWSVLLGSVH